MTTPQHPFIDTALRDADDEPVCGDWNGRDICGRHIGDSTHNGFVPLGAMDAAHLHPHADNDGAHTPDTSSGKET